MPAHSAFEGGQFLLYLDKLHISFAGQFVVFHRLQYGTTLLDRVTAIAKMTTQFEGFYFRKGSEH